MKKTKKLEKRYERKWVFNKENVDIDLNQTFILLKRSNFFFMNQFSDRQVNSIYFDDQHYNSMLQNIEGINNKTKYRLRWYGNFTKIIDPVFEIKKKNGFIVSKENFEMKKINNLCLLKDEDLKEIEKYINNYFNFTNKIFPILSTHYLRSYFISSNNLVRATIDRDLKSLFLYQNRNTNIIKEFNDIILELKYDLDLDDYVRKNIGNISVRLSKNSKFINSGVNVPDRLSYI